MAISNSDEGSRDKRWFLSFCCISKRSFYRDLSRAVLVILVFSSLNLLPPLRTQTVHAATLTNATMDFDTADESGYTQEDAVNGTNFSGGVVKLAGSQTVGGVTSANVDVSNTTYSTLDEGFTVPATGVITSWRVASKSSTSIKLKVYTKNGVNNYTLRGESATESVTASSVNGPFTTSINVQAGDMIGLSGAYNPNINSGCTGSEIFRWTSGDFTGTGGFTYSNTNACHENVEITIQSYPTSQAYYVTTSDNSHINTATWTRLSRVSLTQTTSSGTSDIKYLVSFDGRSTWKYWNGSSWSSSSLANLQTDGISKATIESLKYGDWSASGGFNSGFTQTLDFAMDFSSSSGGVTPSLSQITVEYTETVFPTTICHGAGSANKLACVEFRQSRVMAGASSNHEIFAQTLNGMSAGGHVKITFASGYVLTGLGVDDVDLAVGDSGTCSTATFTEKTLASSATGTAWGVAIDTGLRRITITSGTDTISSDRCVRVRIGTNAVTGSMGNNQIVNPSSAGFYAHAMSIGTATDTGNGGSYILDSDQITISAAVDPVMTFDIDIGTSAGSDSSAPYNIALGAISSSSISSSGDGTIGMIGIDLTSNASGGAIVQVKNVNGTNGLVSASVSSDRIDVATGTLTAGSVGYGLCINTLNASSGTFQQATSGVFGTGQLTSGTSSTCTSAVHQLGTTNLGSSFTDILNSNSSSVGGGRAEIFVKASVSSTTPAHDDYSDTLTFRATATY